MSDENAARPMGFYPDPEVAGQSRFWNGTAWAASVPSYERPSVGAAFGTLSRAVLALLVFQGVLALGDLAVQAWGMTGLTTELENGSAEHADLYDLLDIGNAILALLTFIVTGVFWCIWQYRLARASDLDKVRRTPGMHVASWFIPIIWFWWPLQNMRDLHASYRPGRPGRLLGFWWAAWILTLITDRVTAAMMDDIHSPETFHSYATAAAVSAAATLVTILLAIAVVRRLSRAALPSAQPGESPHN